MSNLLERGKMNIFVLSADPQEAAQLHCDKHVVKMILETGQMLCSAHWIGWKKSLGPPALKHRELQAWLSENVPSVIRPPWKMTHVGHPCTQWCQWSKENYLWLSDLGVELCKEYTVRYGKIHRSEPVLLWLRENLPPTFEGSGTTQFAVAMPDDCRIGGDPVGSYRKYYRVHKRRFAKWKVRGEPSWFSTSSDEP